MNTNINPAKNPKHNKDLTISIPAAIAVLPGINLLEKAVLARINEMPGCSNAGLSRLTGLSVRGIEALLRRLRKRGLIKLFGEGRGRRHCLTFPVEPRTECGSSDGTQCHIQSGQSTVGKSLVDGALKHDPSTAEFIERHISLYEICFNCGKYEFAQRHLEEIRERLESEPDIPVRLRAKFISDLTECENRCFAFEAGARLAEKLTPDKQEKLARVIGTAAADKLTLFRLQMEAGQLAWNDVEVLLLTNS